MGVGQVEERVRVISMVTIQPIQFPMIAVGSAYYASNTLFLALYLLLPSPTMAAFIQSIIICHCSVAPSTMAIVQAF